MAATAGSADRSTASRWHRDRLARGLGGRLDRVRAPGRRSVRGPASHSASRCWRTHARRSVQRRVPRVAGRRLDPSGARPSRDLDRDHPGVHAPQDPGLLGGARRDLPGASLELVVDHHRLAEEPELGAHGDGRRGQREGVGSPAERHDHTLAGLEVRQAGPDRRAHCGPRGPPDRPSAQHAAHPRRGVLDLDRRGQVRRRRPRSGRTPGHRPWRSPSARSPRRWCTGASWSPCPSSGGRTRRPSRPASVWPRTARGSGRPWARGRGRPRPSRSRRAPREGTSGR